MNSVNALRGTAGKGPKKYHQYTNMVVESNCSPDSTDAATSVLTELIHIWIYSLAYLSYRSLYHLPRGFRSFRGEYFIGLGVGGRSLMDLRPGCVGVSHSIAAGSSHSSDELAEFSSSEQLGDGEPMEAPELAPLSLCFFFFFFFSGFPEELTRALVNIDRLYVLTGVREDDRVRMMVVGQLSFSRQTTGWRALGFRLVGGLAAP